MNINVQIDLASSGEYFATNHHYTTWLEREHATNADRIKSGNEY